MKNFNLKYLIIAIIVLSVLMIAGAFVYSLITKPKLPAQTSTQNPQTTPSAIPTPPKAQPAAGPGGGKEDGGIER